jgi:hypothetical protein
MTKNYTRQGVCAQVPDRAGFCSVQDSGVARAFVLFGAGFARGGRLEQSGTAGNYR